MRKNKKDCICMISHLPYFLKGEVYKYTTELKKLFVEYIAYHVYSNDDNFSLELSERAFSALFNSSDVLREYKINKLFK